LVPSAWFPPPSFHNTRKDENIGLSEEVETKNFGIVAKMILRHVDKIIDA
jgi:hypothetical protein